MDKTALQLALTSPGLISAAQTVVFDQTLFSAGDAVYNSLTGEITLVSPGLYFFNWWVNTMSVGAAAGNSFALETLQQQAFTGSSINKSGQVCGFGIIDVTEPPQTVRLINSASAAVSTTPFGQTVASLSVVKEEYYSAADSAACRAAAQWANVLDQIALFYPETSIAVYYKRLATFSAFAYGTYTPPGSDGAAFFVMYAGTEFVLLPLFAIEALYIGGVTLDENFSFLPPPESPLKGCDADLLNGFYSYLSVGDEVGIQIGPTTNASGPIYKNEYGVIILAEEDGLNPLFFFNPNILRVVTTVTPNAGKAFVKNSKNPSYKKVVIQTGE